MTIDKQIELEEENLNEDEQLTKEENDLFNAVLAAILLLSLKYKLDQTIKRKLFLKRSKTLLLSLKKDLVKLNNKKYKISVDEKVLGYTINELMNTLVSKKYVDLKKFVNKNKALDAVTLSNIFEENYKREAINETLSKYVYEKKLDNQTSEYGWVSVAVLDKRTSVICSKLNNKFYSAKTYKSRKDIPNRPPRHFRCRSILVRVDNKEDKEFAQNL